MASDTPALVKIDPHRWSLSDCAAEIRNVVYKEYFQGDEVRILPVLFRGRVLTQVQYEARTTQQHGPDELKYAAILLCSKTVYNEALPFLYDNKTFEIFKSSVCAVGGLEGEILRTASLCALARPIVSHIKQLSLDIERFGYALARLKNVAMTDPIGQPVALDAWQDVLRKWPKLEVLRIKCHNWQEPRNLALRFVTNAHMLCNTTDIVFELNVHGREYKENPEVKSPWEDMDCVFTGGPTKICIPAVKKLVVVGWIFPQELEEVKKVTFGGQRFFESERRALDSRRFDESRYQTGNYRFHEIAHSKVYFEGMWPRVFKESSYIDTEISKYTYRLAEVPVEEGGKSMSPV